MVGCAHASPASDAFDVRPVPQRPPRQRLIDRPEFEFQHSSRESEFITALAFCPRKDDTLAVVGSNVTK